MRKQFFNFHKDTEENRNNMSNEQSQGYEGYQNYGNDYQQNYQQDSFYPYGQQTPEQNPNKKSPKKRKGVKTVAAVAGLAVLFGGIAGGAFYGVNYLAVGNSSSANQIAQADTASLTQVSSGTTNTDLTDLVKASMPFVVSIQNMSVEEVQDFFGGTSQQEATSVGSGIIIGENDTELQIVTNAHVVENADTLTVTFNDDTSLEANIKGSNSDKDLAVVAVPLDSISSDTKSAIKTATLGDSDALQVGEEVVAIGNALGYGQSVTNGIVSAKDREISGYNGTLIQTNAAINPGNSGGALLNTKGEVIGINCAKISDSSVEGMGYAIPVSEVSDIIQELMNQETKTKVSEEEQGSLGIQVMDIDETTAERYGMPQGVYITGLTQNDTDSDLQRGYIITALNGTSITDTSDLQNELGYYRAGEDVTLTVQSAGTNGEYTSQDITVTLVSSQANQ
nr:trypsin-like peptidase domain-containing protein [uncultured Sellimonas sp.]